MLSPILVGPILGEKCLCACSTSNTTKVYPKALEKHFFLLGYIAPRVYVVFLIFLNP